MGCGLVIGTNLLVVESCSPYSVIMGTPSIFKRFRFSVDENIEHEKEYNIQ